MNSHKIITAFGIGITLMGLVTTSATAAGPKRMIREAGENAGSRPGLLRQAFTLRGKAAIGEGSLTAKSGTTLTITRDGKTYTVNTDTSTQFRRRFWGKSSLDELTVGDTLIVIGLWTDDAHTTVLAKLVRDVSIQKRFGVFFGTVSNIAGSVWTLESKNRGTQTVTVSGATKFVNRRGQTISQADVAVGARIRIRGLWDNTAKTVTEVREVKDFSLPPVITPTPKATP